MRLHHLLLGLLVGAGFVGATLLVPGAKELAYMHFKAQNYDFARRDFERMVDGGDFSASVVLPLGELYLIQGEMERAIELVERYVDANPWDVSGLRKLSDFYRYGQRTALQVATLEALIERQPTRDSLRKLMTLHDTLGRVDDQTRVLQTLVQAGLGEADDYELLAFRLAAADKADDARSVLDALRRKFPKSFHDDMAELDLSLALDRGDIAGGFEAARRWIAEFQDKRGAVSLAQVLAARGRADLGLRLLQPIAREPIDDSDVLGAVIDLEFAVGRNEQARRRLLAWASTGLLPELRIPSLIDARLSFEGLDAAMREIDKTDAELLPDWLMVGLVERAVREERASVATNLIERLGTGFLEARPTLAAELAWLRKDRAGFERWTKLALERVDLPLDDKATLARLFVAAKRNDVAIRLMRELILEPATPVALSADLAELYVNLGQQVEGLTLFSRLKAERPSPVVEASWARLAALSGRGDEVVAWLERAVDPGAQLLEDLFFVANDTRQGALALAAATKLYNLRPTRDVTRHLAEALIQNGKPKEALGPLRALLPGDADLRATYAAALEAAGETEELARLRSGEIEDLAEDDPRRAELAQLLIDLGAFDRALPVLRRLAEEPGGRWLDQYADAAKKAGRSEEAIPLLREKILGGGLPRETEERALHALVALAGAQDALAELRRAAEVLGGDWLYAYAEAASKAGRVKDVTEMLVARLGRSGASESEGELLLSLLMEKSPDVAIDYLDQAARRDPDRWADRLIDALETLKRRSPLIALLKRELDRPLPRAKRDARLFLLIDRGGEAEALPYIARIARSEGGDWIGAYDAALAKLGRIGERNEFLVAISREPGRKIEERRQAAFRLLEVDRRNDAVAAFRALADAAPANSPDVEQLLYLWGPRPLAADVDWLERRAAVAKAGDFELWLRRLINIGASNRVLRLIAQAETFGPKLVSVEIEALANTRDYSALSRAIDRGVAAKFDAPTMRHYARLAEQEGQLASAAKAYAAMLQMAPDDRNALSGTGRIAYAQGRRGEAKARFARLAEIGKDDFETAYLLGEIWLAEKKAIEARAAWTRSLALIAGATVRPYSMRAIEALVLHRLGRGPEALRAFEALREERPKDAGLIGDYANVLLDLGLRDRAAALLAGH